jgi:hypothetical protein
MHSGLEAARGDQIGKHGQGVRRLSRVEVGPGVKTDNGAAAWKESRVWEGLPGERLAKAGWRVGVRSGTFGDRPFEQNVGTGHAEPVEVVEVVDGGVDVIAVSAARGHGRARRRVGGRRGLEEGAAVNIIIEGAALRARRIGG